MRHIELFALTAIHDEDESSAAVYYDTAAKSRHVVSLASRFTDGRVLRLDVDSPEGLNPHHQTTSSLLTSNEIAEAISEHAFIIADATWQRDSAGKHNKGDIVPTAFMVGMIEDESEGRVETPTTKSTAWKSVEVKFKERSNTSSYTSRKEAVRSALDESARRTVQALGEAMDIESIAEAVDRPVEWVCAVLDE